MTSAMTTSAISKLDNDTLLSIFDTITSQIPNSNIPRVERPITIVQVASQVCRWWRDLLLASPLIWGRLIDLDEEHGPLSKEWMEEVARRAGSAPLWIYGDVEEHRWNDKFDSESYFIRLLESHWEQIERISVLVTTYNATVRTHICSLFLRPAPILKLFGVRLLDRQILETNFWHGSGLSESLFADYAPRLQAMSTGHFPYRSDSSWLCNIREIDPFPVHSTFMLKDIFDILQHTPLINRINISRESRKPLSRTPQGHFPKLILPNLTSIHVETTLRALSWILDHISPGILSELSIYVLNRRTLSLNDSKILASLTKNLPLYISGPFISNPSTIVILGISESTFRLGKLANRVPAHDVFSYGRSVFNVEIVLEKLADPQDWESVLVCLLDVFLASLGGYPSGVKFVTELWMPYIEVQPSIIPKLYTLLHLFCDVQDIETAEEYGHTLFALSCLDDEGDGEDPQHVLFPQLRTLYLRTTEREDGIVLNDITQFLIRRKEIGFPVAKLDLTRCKISNYAQDLRDLEAVAGLEVVWKNLGSKDPGEGEENCNYICGTGHPEQLVNLVDATLYERSSYSMLMWGSDSDSDM